MSDRTDHVLLCALIFSLFVLIGLILVAESPPDEVKDRRVQERAVAEQVGEGKLVAFLDDGFIRVYLVVINGHEYLHAVCGTNFSLCHSGSCSRCQEFSDEDAEVQPTEIIPTEAILQGR